MQSSQTCLFYDDSPRHFQSLSFDLKPETVEGLSLETAAPEGVRVSFGGAARIATMFKKLSAEARSSGNEVFKVNGLLLLYFSILASRVLTKTHRSFMLGTQ